VAADGFREIGVVEGFYGRVWTPAERGAFIEALLPFGLNTYLYCPKHEAALAAEAMGELNGEAALRLRELATLCRARGVSLWAGLHLEPPLTPGDPEHLRAIARKCLALAQLGCSGFAVLFDDVPAIACPPVPGGDSVAATHAHAVSEIRREAAALGVEGSWSIVPARYTPDPLLEKEYGPFEPDYLARLDAGLPPDVAWFYTGPRVCSPTIDLGHLSEWQGNSRREVLLWDNYPVNDAAMVNHLHLSPLTGRAPDLPRGMRGYLFNPLLQPALGILPGATCLAYANDPAGYDFQAAWQRALAALLPPGARRAFAELEALTRRSCLLEYLPEAAFAKAGSLAARLQSDWAALAAGKPAPNGAARALEELVAELTRALPASMGEQARPWLARLGQAAAIMGAREAGDAPGEAAEAYRKGEAYVLGEWFDP
jgi:hypothetical protein